MSKVLILDTILRNPKLKKQFEEAYNAPVGSTKRKAMTSVLSSIKKIGDRTINKPQDGQGGGPASDPFSSYGAFSTNAFNQTPNIGVMKPAPTNSITGNKTTTPATLGTPDANRSDFVKTVDAANDVARDIGTGAVDMMSSAKNFIQPAIDAPLNVSSSIVAMGEAVPSWVNTYFTGGKYKELKDTYGGQQIIARMNAAKDKQAEFNKIAAENKNTGLIGPQNKPAGTPAGPAGEIVTGQDGKVYAMDSTGKQTLLTTPAQIGEYRFKKGYTDSRKTKTVAVNQPMGTGQTGTGNTSSTPQGYSGGTGAANPEIQGDTLILESGPLATFNAQMSSEANRRKFFPGQTEDFYKNGSGNLQAMLADMKAHLKTESGLDALDKQYNEALLTQQNIVPDLIDYVKRRETAIKDLDGLIAKAEADYGKSTNIAQAKAQKDYITNLYTMKERQSVKYTDMINRAQQVADKDLTRLTTKINDVTTKLNSDIADMTNITTEQYNNMKALVTEAWTYADQLPAKQLAKKQLIAAEAALDAQNQAGALGATGTGTGLLNISEAKSYRDTILDNEEKLKPGMDLTTALGDYTTMVNNNTDKSAISAMYPVNAIRSGYKNGLNAQIKGANGDLSSDDATSLQNLGKYLQDFENNKAKLDAISPTDANGQLTGEFGNGTFRDQVADTLISGAQRLIQGYIPGNEATLKAATLDLKNVSTDAEAGAWKKKYSSLPQPILLGLLQSRLDLKTDFNQYYGLNKTGGFAGLGGSDSFNNGIYDKISYGLKALINRDPAAQ